VDSTLQAGQRTVLSDIKTGVWRASRATTRGSRLFEQASCSCGTVLLMYLKCHVLRRYIYMAWFVACFGNRKRFLLKTVLKTFYEPQPSDKLFSQPSTCRLHTLGIAA
jgi:hypothetical protein